jgi:hypothetical protein
MPQFDGLDIPAVEWCSIPQAILWIEARDVPVKEFHESLLPDRIDATEEEKESGKKRLVLQAATGGVKLRGKPSKGKVEVVFDESQRPSHAKCDEWGELATIPPGKVEEAGLAGLQGENGELIGCDPSSTAQWAYSDVEVNFKQLMALYPAPAGEKIRVGGNPVPVGQTDPVPTHETTATLALPPPRTAH